MSKAFSHERVKTGKDEWLTPPEIIRALGNKFELDPCAPIIRPWDTAIYHFTILDNGLMQQWHGRVWLNPPYGTQTSEWLARMAAHRNGIVLIYARTETKYFFDYVWDKADAILFMKGRIRFYNVDGTIGKNCGGAPSCLIAYGEENVEALKRSGLEGKIIYLKQDGNNE